MGKHDHVDQPTDAPILALKVGAVSGQWLQECWRHETFQGRCIDCSTNDRWIGYAEQELRRLVDGLMG